MKVLSIGNSFSQDAHKWLHKLAELNGVEMETLNLCNSGSDKITELSINASGAISCNSELIKVHTRKGRTVNGEEGFAAEISIPLSFLEAETGDYIRIYAETEGETFTDSTRDDSGTWQRIYIE